MNADLQRLIALQRLDSSAHEAHRRLAEEPERQKALDERVEAVRQRLTQAQEHLARNQNARRSVEKEVAVHQGRLSKYRDQLMAVKTNAEYQAMQKEIGHAQTEVKRLEDSILELMLEADELGAAVKGAERALAGEQKATEAERKALGAELDELKKSLERVAADRAALLGELPPQLVATFELVARRRHGIAVAEARDGICTICHVRLRPQVFNTIRRNEDIVQCESCQRILYFVPAPAAQDPAVAQQPAS
jgi:predicted  nucleic acid-binding Zn-ribbon protein